LVPVTEPPARLLGRGVYATRAAPKPLTALTFPDVNPIQIQYHPMPRPPPILCPASDFVPPPPPPCRWHGGKVQPNRLRGHLQWGGPSPSKQPRGEGNGSPCVFRPFDRQKVNKFRQTGGGRQQLVEGPTTWGAQVARTHQSKSSRDGRETREGRAWGQPLIHWHGRAEPYAPCGSSTKKRHNNRAGTSSWTLW